MDISVLGPLTAFHRRVNVVPTAAKPRTLLALLAAYSGHVIPTDVIVAELWEEDPPPSASTTIQTYVLQLRRLLQRAIAQSPDRPPADDAKQILRTEPGGYLLDQSDGTFDAAEHQRLAAAGHEAIQAGDFRAARDRLNAALRLWRGAAFVDVQTGARLSAQATLLEESRKTALERRIEADLHLGRHHELVGELAGLTAEHRTDEQLHAHFIIALCRAGRRTHALTVFGRLRTALAEELGLDISPNLARLHHAMLVADPALENGHSAHRPHHSGRVGAPAGRRAGAPSEHPA
jgi:DNA-binding SARP family transcriptional activator